jgi:hypothetical protein
MKSQSKPIKKEKLHHNGWYFGEGEYVAIALWDSCNFLTIDTSTHQLKTLEYGTEFKPLVLIESSFTPYVKELVDKLFIPVTKV